MAILKSKTLKYSWKDACSKNDQKLTGKGNGSFQFSGGFRYID